VMNQALNQTLSRTIITSGTVFLATSSLYLFGGGAINAFAFVLVMFAVMTWKRKSDVLDTPLESFFDSLAGAVRYMRYAPGVQIVLLRNFIFGVLIGAIPALLPVIGLKSLHLDPLKLGFVFTSMGVGSLAGALFILEPARKKLSPNQMTMLSGIVLAASYALMAIVRQPQVFFIVAALAGVAWTVSASELWVAGQRVIPDWIRGRRGGRSGRLPRRSGRTAA